MLKIDACTGMFIAVLVTTDKRQKQHKCPTMVEQKQNVEDSPYNEIIFYHKKRNEVLMTKGEEGGRG